MIEGTLSARVRKGYKERKERIQREKGLVSNLACERYTISNNFSFLFNLQINFCLITNDDIRLIMRTIDK